MNNSAVPKIAIIFFTLFISALTFMLGLGVGQQISPLTGDGNILTRIFVNNKETPSTVDKTVDFDRFWEVWDKMNSDYINDNPDPQKMLDGAIKGMVEAVGDHVTDYYTVEETKAYEEISAGNFEGIGAELGYSENAEIIIKNPLKGSPALEAGLLPGDIISKVDGEDISELAINDVVLKIRGEKGTKVVLTIKREGKDPEEITITRDEIHVDSIEIIGEDQGIVTIRINRFTESNYDSFAQKWDSIVDEVLQKNPKGLIIDLRGNPGGYLEGGIYTASEFLEKGDVVLYIEGRDGIEDTRKSVRDGKLKDIPVVLLVNENTASASEIFSGALRFHKQTVIIGEKTVGKGTAQEVYKPEGWNGASLHLTVQKWLLPDKTWLNPDNPIVPDIEVSLSDEDFQIGKDPQMDKAIESIKEKI